MMKAIRNWSICSHLLSQERVVVWSSWGPGTNDQEYLAPRTHVEFLEYLTPLLTCLYLNQEFFLELNNMRL